MPRQNSFFGLTCLISVCFLWIFSFRGFLFGHLALVNDALVYLENTKFYVDNLLQGIYPLWDPTRDLGVPNQLFLRRIGEFNPLLFVLIALVKTGVSFKLSYMIFIVLNYFLGLFGFYKLAQKFLKDDGMALMAVILLMFSSFSFILFRSFMILIFTPMVWFFYCLVAFSEKQEKLYWFGLVFSLMMILTTYIPFYFLTVFLVFLSVFVILYFSYLKTLVRKYCLFFIKNKILVATGVLLLVLASLPGFLFYCDALKGEIIFPTRHVSFELQDQLMTREGSRVRFQNQLSVMKQSTAQGGIPATELVDLSFSELKQIHLGTLYMPIFIYIIFFLGLFKPINRRFVLIVITAFIIYLIGLYDATSIYPFLYDHIFYFKYFRNFQFFLWLVLMPVCVLIGIEHLKMFSGEVREADVRKGWSILFVVLVHAGIAGWLFLKTRASLTTVAVLGLSLLVFGLFVLNPPKQLNRRWLIVFTLLLIILEPIEVFSYLSQNSQESRLDYRYQTPYLTLRFPKEQPSLNALQQDPSDTRKPTPVYISTVWVNRLRENIRPDILDDYTNKKFIVYDRVQYIEEYNLDYKQVEQFFTENRNVALVSGEDIDNKAFDHPDYANRYPYVITTSSKDFKVLDYTVNSITVQTNFDSKKFLVYNDSFHSQWRAYVNGKRTQILRSNIGFKGVWLAAGPNILTFRFGLKWHQGLYAILLCAFLCSTVYLCVLCIRNKEEKAGYLK